jgi:hypothetical protein
MDEVKLKKRLIKINKKKINKKTKENLKIKK